ncbi:ribosomal-protein-alanine N-acetyltransferase [Aquimarina sp. EL_43]|uniref:GNAT family N-acetyltransferase n=1 Tax=Aquimarina TaxID=290174 RepID=UPI0004704767|nr:MULTISPECIES: GNAT family N-acetyltransferase [Aquimarina]MBG6129266.1 ribosomal-protein-alanine N-acetyltransferase [Aquimarina sp. EL_35]MBG6150331.1 ribosomal-protein-alanine N-acetyltransferase [Aquimarina sp. EL_32]MBG6166983.1 ribosomal-protein-alanine N-acetyltransferase [Aquimarina sp. EL_43]
MFPELQTERLFLRQLKESDDQVILFLRSNEIVNTFVKRPKTNTTEEAISFINKINKGIDQQDWLFWGITVKNNPELIGTICLWNFSEDKKIAEVGYDLHPDFYKQGIMNEALISILNYGFKTLELDHIEAFTHKNNEPSKKLLMRNNFNHIEDRIDSDNPDNIIFSISRNK